MKKHIIIIYIFSALTSFGQNYWGFYGGLNLSTVKYDNPAIQQNFRQVRKPLIGYKLGIYGDFYFSEALSLKVETIYTKKGFKYVQSYSSGWKKFNYIQLNFKGKTDFNPFDKTVFSLYLGIYGSYWISGEKMNADSKTGIVLHDTIYLKSDTTFRYNRFDTGLIFGAEIKRKIDRKQYIFADISFDLGMLSNAIKNVDGTKNRTLFFGVGYCRKF